MGQTAPHCLRIGTALGVALIATASPATAQQSELLTASKTEAILGGSSRLAAVMAAQVSGAPTLVAAATIPAIDAETIRAALPTPPPFAVAALAVPAADDGASIASPERPDVFNSVAMPIDRTPLDERWGRVGSAVVRGPAAYFATSLRERDRRERIEAINAYVNQRVSFVDDIREFGVPDRWSGAAETLGRGRGDCEDYALAKLALLRRAGFADRDLYFVVLKDLSRRADHAVLVVRSEGRFLVLDNGTDQLIDSSQVRDYRPILTFTAGQRFTHGYRRSVTPPVVLASYPGEAREPGRVTISTSAGLPSSPFASR